MLPAGRAVVVGDSRQVDRLHARHSMLRDHLLPGARPRLVDARAFTVAVAEARTAALRASDPPEDKKSARVAARWWSWAELWAPMGKRLVLRGTRIRPEGLASPKSFEGIRMSPRHSAPLGGLRTIAKRSDRPTETGFWESSGDGGTLAVWFLQRPRTSLNLPGGRVGRPPDRMGFPTRLGRSTLGWPGRRWRMSSGSLRTGSHLILPFFNAALTVFGPKGTELDDSEGGIRYADACRPLGLRNTDFKAIAAAANHKLAPALSREAHQAQRGFVRGRQLALNAVELDGCAREAAARARFTGKRDLVLAFLTSMPLFRH